MDGGPGFRGDRNGREGFGTLRLGELLVRSLGRDHVAVQNGLEGGLVACRPADPWSEVGMEPSQKPIRDGPGAERRESSNWRPGSFDDSRDHDRDPADGRRSGHRTVASLRHVEEEALGAGSDLEPDSDNRVMYIVNNRNAYPPVYGVAGLGIAWASIPGIMAVFQGLYSKLFNCATPDSVSLDFDPEGRPGGRLYDKGSQVGSIIINDFQKPIWTAYGISQGDVHEHVWSPIFQYFASHGGGWNIDVNSWVGITSDFFGWLISKGIQVDPRPYFAAHDNLQVAMLASCGSGRRKIKNFIPFRQVADKLMEQVAGSIPSGGGGNGGGGTNIASMFAGIKTEYLVLGAIGLLLFGMAAKAKKRGAQQFMFMPQY